MINLDTTNFIGAGDKNFLQKIPVNISIFLGVSASRVEIVPVPCRPGHETLASERINGQDNNEACRLLSPAARGRLSVTEMFSHPDFMHEVYLRGRQAAVHR